MKNEHIEDITAQRIREYEGMVNATVTLPVPIEQVVEQTLDLSILWDTIEEEPGEIILGGLQPKARMIVLNEKHLPLFKEKPGLLRSTIGHEAGHWEIDVDKMRFRSLSLFGDGGDQITHRHASKSDQSVQVLLNLALRDEQAYRMYKQLTAGQDTPEQRSAVDRYQSALLMPAWLMKEAAQPIRIYAVERPLPSSRRSSGHYLEPYYSATSATAHLPPRRKQKALSQ